MQRENTRIELRSEKVRNIIGQVPPVLLRHGIMIIGASLLILIAISAFIPYQPSIDIEMTVMQAENGFLHYSSQLPQSAVKHQSQFTKVLVDMSLDLPIPAQFQIESISETVHLSGQHARYTVALRPTDKISENILLKEPITVPAKILLQKQSVMKWILGRVARN